MQHLYDFSFCNLSHKGSHINANLLVLAKLQIEAIL